MVADKYSLSLPLPHENNQILTFVRNIYTGLQLSSIFCVFFKKPLRELQNEFWILHNVY